MIPQEAINWLEAIEEKYIHGGDDYFDEKRKIAINIAISALEKQIPKKPKNREGTTYFYCPCCDSNNLNEYCPNCGQALDWSDAK